MNESADGHWELAGYSLWIVGSALFIIASARAGDWYAISGSVLFFIGVVVVMVPMIKARQRG